MKRFLQVMLLVATVIAFGSTPVRAQGMNPGMMEQGRGMGEMGKEHKQGTGDMSQHGMQGMGSMAMDKQMQELQQHEKMMEGIEDQKQLMTEMRKHMRMMTDMMGEMMHRQGGATAGSGGMPEHQ
jgi:hypothetical protein